MMNTRSVQRTLLASAGLKAIPVGSLGEIQDPGMRIGLDYQAVVPEFVEGVVSNGPGSVLLWKPSSLLTEHEIDNYVKLSKDQFKYSIDQALGMLYYHHYDVNKAFCDLPNFCPLQDDWSLEDKVIFEQAFHYHGKNFQRIHSMLPDKPVNTLVKYYYLWKRSYSRYSLLDKHSKKNGKKMSSGLPPSNEDTDSIHSGSTRSEAPPILPPVQLVGKGKQLPKGIYMSTNELSALATEEEGISIKMLDKELILLKEMVQIGKQEITELRDQVNITDVDIEKLRPVNYSQKLGLPTRWTDEEITVALEVINECGKNVEALSRALPGKNISQCRNFFTNYKRKLNLPRLIAEYELKHGQKLSRYSRQAAEQLRSEQEVLPVNYSQDQEMLSINPIMRERDAIDDLELGNKRPRMAGFDLMDGDEYM